MIAGGYYRMTLKNRSHREDEAGEAVDKTMSGLDLWLQICRRHFSYSPREMTVTLGDGR